MLLMYYLLQRPQDIIQTFPGTQIPVSMQNGRKAYNSNGTLFLSQIIRMLGSVIISMKHV